MKKIIVIGSPGAGKSVFSRKLKESTNIPLYPIDMMYHNKDGTHITQEELKEFLKEHLKIELYTHRESYRSYLGVTIKIDEEEIDSSVLYDIEL